MADMRKITVTEALVELKLYDAKINKAINSASFIGCKKKSAEKVGAFNVDVFEKKVQADYQSIRDLIDNRAKIKAAIVQSNAITTVEIGGNKYTVAEAIEMRNNSINYKKICLHYMKEQWQKVVKEVDKHNRDVDVAVDQMLDTFLGKESDKKISEADLSAISDPYREKNEWEYIDPINLYDKIKELEEKIDNFESEVDTKLSVSNSITYIEV